MEKEIGILFIHGFGHHSECWINFKEEFKKKGFHKLYFFNYKNHGQNLEENNTYHTNDDYSKDLYEYIIKNDLKNYIIIAHSNGCLVTHYCITKYNIKPYKIFLLGPLQDNNSMNVTLNMILDYNLWPFFIRYKFEGKKFIRYALFKENTNEEIIENSKYYLEKVHHTKIKYINLNKKIIKDITPYIILGEHDKIIPLKIALKTIELYNYNGIIKTFDTGHNIMLDNDWKTVFNYILININS
jgi:pimeloyl-ACP methyl ester carboxylesterase